MKKVFLFLIILLSTSVNADYKVLMGSNKIKLPEKENADSGSIYEHLTSSEFINVKSDEGIEAIHPIMSSDSVNGYVATANSVYSSGYPPFAAFNGTATWGNAWLADNYAHLPHILTMTFPEKRAVTGFGISAVPGGTVGGGVIRGVIQGSVDGSTWENLYSLSGLPSEHYDNTEAQNNPDIPENSKRHFVNVFNGEYKAMRIVVEEIYVDGRNRAASIFEMVYYGPVGQ